MRVGVRMHVRLMIAAKVAVPCVVGWMKPVILLPPAALTGSPPLSSRWCWPTNCRTSAATIIW